MRFLLLLTTMLFTAHAFPASSANPAVSLTTRNEDDSPAEVADETAEDSSDHVELSARSEEEPEEQDQSEESVELVARRYDDDSEEEAAPETTNDDDE